MTAEICCPLILVTTLLLVVKYSTALSVVTGVVVLWVSLTIIILLLCCGTFCWLCSELADCVTGVTDGPWSGKLSVTVQDEDDRT